MITATLPILLYLPRVWLSATVTKEVAELGVRDIMAAMTHSCTDRTYANAIYHLAGVAVIPMLVHELPLGHRECAQFVLEHGIFVL